MPLRPSRPSSPRQQQTAGLKKDPITAFRPLPTHFRLRNSGQRYRFDPQRSCATSATGPSDLSIRWKTDIGCAPTSPVVAAGKLFFGATDRHAIWAIDADSGEKSWSYVTGGPIDSPPTVYKGLALCGSRDGWAYALNASNGRLVYRFRGAPAERRIVAFDRLESAWPIHGSILVTNGVAYLTAGRQSFVDGGIFVYALDPFSGRTLQKTQVLSPELQGIERKDYEIESPGLPVPLSKFYDMPPENLGAVSDILTADGGLIYMRNLRLDPADIGRPVSQARQTIDARFGSGVRQDPVPGPQVVSDAGFLDGSWFNQVYWTYRNSRGPSCWSLMTQPPTALGPTTEKRRADTIAIAFSRGRATRCSPTTTRPTRSNGLSRFQSASKRWCWPATSSMLPARAIWQIRKTPGLIGREKRRSIVCLFGGDGGKQKEIDLESPPVFNGMCVAGARLYMSTIAGTVVCIGSTE